MSRLMCGTIHVSQCSLLPAYIFSNFNLMLTNYARLSIREEKETAEEMCLVFLDYFPKIDLNQCGASFKLPPYLKAIGLHTTGSV